jgi:signal transduction histidine kinase
MDGLVWAVNPANDTLDHLAMHLSAVAQEIFRDSPMKLRISIPPDLPAVPLRSDFRHHFALGVKEALHNVLKHAGPCEVSFSLFTDHSALVAEIEDTGQGFDVSIPREGNGLHNLAARFEELGGTCVIESVPGKGSRAVFRCQLPKVAALPNA